MFEQVRIAPSILSADFMAMGADIALIEEAGAGFVHVDVMDGHFVPNLSMGVPLVKQLAKATGLPLDVHLMVSNPLDQIPWFADAGADSLTVHAEVLYGDALARAVEMIHAAGCKAAVSLKPKTPVETLAPVIADLDMVLIMSVNPGFGGQKFIEHSLDKVRELRELITVTGSQALIEVDGGVNLETGSRLVEAGADVLVAGNAVFSAPDPKEAIRALRNL